MTRSSSVEYAHGSAASAGEAEMVAAASAAASACCGPAFMRRVGRAGPLDARRDVGMLGIDADAGAYARGAEQARDSIAQENSGFA